MSVVNFILGSQILSVIAGMGIICGLAQIFSKEGILSFDTPFLQVSIRILFAVGLVLCFFVDVPMMTQAGSVIRFIVQTFVGILTLGVTMYVVQFIGSVILGLISWIFAGLF